MSDDPNPERARLLADRDAISAEIGRLRKAGLPADDQIARHRKVSARLQALRNDSGAAPGETMATPPAFTTRVETTPEGFAALRDEWNDLLECSVADTPFLRWEWLYSWWEVFGGGRQLRLVTVRDGRDGKLAALAPMMLGVRDSGRLRGEVLGFIGTSEIAEGDYFNIILRTGYAREALTAVWQALCARQDEYDLISLRDVWTADPTLLELIACAADAGCGAMVQTKRQSVCGALGASFTEFIAAVPDSYRRNQLRATDEYLPRCGEGATHAVAATEAAVAQALQAVARFSSSRQASKGGRSAWLDPRFGAFMQAACERLREAGALVVDTLRRDGVVTAAMIGLRQRGRYCCYQVGFDPVAPPPAPVHHLIARRIRACIEDGEQVFDFLAGTHEYKTQYFRGRRPVGHVHLFPGDARSVWRIGQMMLAQGIRGQAKRWLRRRSRS